jgi:hypothetical protein
MREGVLDEADITVGGGEYRPRFGTTMKIR